MAMKPTNAVVSAAERAAPVRCQLRGAYPVAARPRPGGQEHEPDQVPPEQHAEAGHVAGDGHAAHDHEQRHAQEDLKRRADGALAGGGAPAPGSAVHHGRTPPP